MAQTFNKNALAKSVVFSAGGTFYLSDLDENDKPVGNWESMGVVDSATLNIEVENIEKDAPNFGILQTVSNLVKKQTGTVSMTISEFGYEQLASNLYGDYSLDAETSVVAQSYAVEPGKYVLVDGLVKYVDGSSITIEDDLQTITYIEGENYTVDMAGFYIMTAEEQAAANAANVLSAGTAKFSFGYQEVETIQGFTKTSNKKAVKFVGISQDDDKYYLVTINKVSFNPTDGLPFIVDEYGSFNIEGTMETVDWVGTGESQFFKLQKQA